MLMRRCCSWLHVAWTHLAGSPWPVAALVPLHGQHASAWSEMLRLLNKICPDNLQERRVRSLLNKICPDNLQAITEQLAAIELNNVEQLETIIKLIFGIALTDPHYCETYADMVFTLKSRYIEFPAKREGEKAVTFAQALLNGCQNDFESLPPTFEPTDEESARMETADLDHEMRLRKKKMLANMKFIGHLFMRKKKMLANMKFIGHRFLRHLLAVKVIGQVVHDLIGIKEGLPEEHKIECTCELLCTIGCRLSRSFWVPPMPREPVSGRCATSTPWWLLLDGSCNPSLSVKRQPVLHVGIVHQGRRRVHRIPRVVRARQTSGAAKTKSRSRQATCV